MPKITELPIIPAIIDATTFVVVNNGLTRRFPYQDLSSQILANVPIATQGTFGTQGLEGPQGVRGLQGLSGQGTQGVLGAQGSSTGTQGIQGANAGQGVQGVIGQGTQGVTGSGSSYARSTAAGATASIANNATGNISITGFKSYSLFKVQTSAAAWVRLYVTNAARTDDNTRIQTTDPTPGSGVIAEVITTGAQTQLMTPAIFGFNDDTTPGNTIYLAITNLSGSTASIIVTLTLLRLET
jgi:hypothetical protein